MRRLLATCALISTLALLAGCKVPVGSTAEFGDQNFKTAIALIELHKVRNGTYPKALSDIHFTGEWDRGPLHSVEYRLLNRGYELNIVHGFGHETPQLSYPPEFWHGLGVVKSNVKGAPQGGGA